MEISDHLQIHTNQGRPFLNARRRYWVLRHSLALELQFSDLKLADFIFLHFPGDGHREGVNKSNVLRDLEVCDFALAELADFIGTAGLIFLESNPRTD